MFEPLPAKFDFPEGEKRVLEFWQKHDVFGKSLELRRGRPHFVFYEGPPTANGVPHPGHCLTRAMKDLFPRYQTMRGCLVERKAGWDTHGLPVEIEVCRELGINSKEEIEAYGVDKFVKRCIESVFRYVREWEEMTDRLGFWINLDEAYVTYHQSYVESVWWGLKTLFERGLLYQGHKVVWWWAQGGTALSAGEVGEGYRTVEDPSVYIRFPLLEEGIKGLRDQGIKGKVSLLVWTTTPWTLISNHFAAVHPLYDYALVHDKTGDEYFYIATDLVEPTFEKVKHKFELLATCRGEKLVGLRYVPPFESYYSSMADTTASLKDGAEAHVGWRVLPADFVTLDTGTGIVHQAPAYGEVDFELLQEERRRFLIFDAIPLINAVAPDGTFTDEAPEQYRSRWVKDCDDEIMREMTERGIMFLQETVKHEYPFCPRAEDDPLIQYARKSWFVRTSQFKDAFLENNAAINWLPEHIKEGRFGDFLRNNVDWALSRERYWGTPLPIWVCEKTGKMEAIGSYAELLAKPGVQGTEVWENAKKADPELPDHLKVHKPYIDAITYDSPFVEEGTKARRHEGTKGNSEPGASATGPKPRMRRVPEVIDCWWDAGSMPFAQWGFPHVDGSVQTFSERFPCDFISEAIDQTRGWFYGLLAISTLLFGKAAHEHMLDHMLQGATDRGVPEAQRKLMAALFGRSGEPLDAATLAKAKEELVGKARSKGLPEAQINAMVYAIDHIDEYSAAHGKVAPRESAYMSVATCSVDDGPEQLAGITAPYPQPYKTCIVLGHVMGEDGLKMSKRTGNYKEPGYIFDHYGADAMRWYFFSAQTPWTSIRFQEAAIRDSQREFLVRLYNVFSFFNIYANIDGFEVRHEGTEVRRHEEPRASARAAATGWRPVSQRSEIDRWISSELHRTIRFVRDAMDRFENCPAAGRLNDFVDALSNWYVRRSRDRFWRPLDEPRASARAVQRSPESTSPRGLKSTAPLTARDQDKWDAYNTLYEVLVALSKLVAPFTPFFAETMYQNLVRHEGTEARRREGGRQSSALPSEVPVSVHLCDYPEPEAALIDENLAQEMELVRQVVSTGRAARTAAKLKVRQPLAQVEIILAWREYEERLKAHTDLIAEELNVKRVEFTHEADHYVHYQIKPSFKTLGPKFGRLAPKVGAALAALDNPAAARKTLLSEGDLSLTVDGQTLRLTKDDVDIRLETKKGWSAAQGKSGVVVVSTELTPELREEGLIRELIHHVQGLRKKQDLAYEARVTLHVTGPEDFLDVVGRFKDTISNECLAEQIDFAVPSSGDVMTAKIEGHEVKIGIQTVRAR